MLFPDDDGGDSTVPVKTPREMCYRCHKASVMCICGTIAVVENRTPVTILQHPREQKHALGTVRFARLGLARINVVVADGDGARGIHVPMELPEGCAILFPGEDSVPLESLSGASRPTALLVLDGTWSTAGKLYKDNPWMHRLKKVSLQPAQPGNYRIRKEPRPECLSTIESIVMALSILEPETVGLSGLLGAFTTMVDRQIVVTSHRREGRTRKAKTNPTTLAQRMPAVISEQPERVLLLYTESTHQHKQGRSDRRRLLLCLAIKPETGEEFSGYLRQEAALSPPLLHYLGLPESHVEQGSVTEERSQFEARWRKFVGSDSVWVAWNKSNLDLMRSLVDRDPETHVLKGLIGNLDGKPQGGAQDAALRKGLEVDVPRYPGRSGRRMAAVEALYHELRRQMGS